MRLLADKNILGVGLEDGSIELINATTGERIRRLDSGSAAPQALASSPDGRRLFVAGIEGNIHCFDTLTWEETHALAVGTNERPHLLACAPDGKTIAVVTKTGTLHVLRTE